MDIKEIIRKEVKKYIKNGVEQTIQKIRVSCMKFLKEKTLEIYKNKITEVYNINKDRKQIVDLPSLFKSIKIIDNNKWIFSIILDERDIKFETQSGEPVYQYYHNGEFGDTYNSIVTNFNEYWHDPIAGITEDDWYNRATIEDLIKYINDDFSKYIKILLGGK